MPAVDGVEHEICQTVSPGYSVQRGQDGDYRGRRRNSSRSHERHGSIFELWHRILGFVNGIGYGGYRYDGRYGPVVDKIIQYYGLSPGDKIFELGCGKGYILVEFLIRGMQVAGVDLSCYAIANAAPNVRPFVRQGDFLDMELSVQKYDLVLGKDIMAHIAEASVAEVVEKCKQLSKKYIYYEIEVCRNDFEAEMLYKWDITHVTRRPPNWWKEKLYEVGYPGDYHFKVLIEDPALGSFE